MRLASEPQLWPLKQGISCPCQAGGEVPETQASGGRGKSPNTPVPVFPNESKKMMHTGPSCTLAVPSSLRMLKQEDGYFEASLGYMLSPYFNNKQK